MTDYRQSYWNYISSGKLCLQFCPACQKYIFYPRGICPYCLQSILEWKEASGRGVVHSYTTIQVSALPHFQNDTPYIYALVDLEEGVRMPSNLIECPPDELSTGLPVELVFIVRHGKTLPVFKPVTVNIPALSFISPDVGEI